MCQRRQKRQKSEDKQLKEWTDQSRKYENKFTTEKHYCHGYLDKWTGLFDWIPANTDTRTNQVCWHKLCCYDNGVHDDHLSASTHLDLNTPTQWSPLAGFPLFQTDIIPWYFHDFSRFFSKFPGIFFIIFKVWFPSGFEYKYANILSFISTKN